MPFCNLSLPEILVRMVVFRKDFSPADLHGTTEWQMAFLRKGVLPFCGVEHDCLAERLQVIRFLDKRTCNHVPEHAIQLK